SAGRAARRRRPSPADRRARACTRAASRARPPRASPPRACRRTPRPPRARSPGAAACRAPSRRNASLRRACPDRRRAGAAGDRARGRRACACRRGTWRARVARWSVRGSLPWSSVGRFVAGERHRLDATRRAHEDLDALLGRCEELLPLARELHAFFVDRERLFERELARLELTDDLAQPREDR